MKRICTICARAGSKGLAGKNIRELAGKPLLAHSILQARDSGLFQTVAVSSDSEDILSVARCWGADCLVKRPPELASDTAPKLPAIRHCLKAAEERLGEWADIVVDLDVTSPLRSISDIREAVALLEARQVSNVITGTPARRSPYFNMVEEEDDGSVRLVKPLPRPVFRRQDAPLCFEMNASVYVWRREALLQNNSVFNRDTLLYVMPPERSVDIDSEVDFLLVELLMKMRNGHGEGNEI